MVNPPQGITSQEIEYSLGTFMAIAAFTAVAWYNVAELNIQVFLTFKRHRGLYFWSLLITSYGCVLHALGFLLKFLVPATNIYISITIITIGWYCMVTGQAVVLYSRLHLVVREQRVLRGILAMIIVDAICFHIPTTVLTYGSNTPHPRPNFLKAFNVVEKLQMTAFCLQEFVISGVYVWATISLLRPVYHGRTRKVMTQLIWINLIIILMDVGLLAVEYSNLYDIEATLKAMVYSIKLKLEFAVLNQLMTLANSSVNNHQNLHVEDGAEKGANAPSGRSKSTEYISHKYQKPAKKQSHQRPPLASGLHKSRSTSNMPVPRSSSYTTHHRNRFQWVPDLDRNTYLGTKHVEHAEHKKPELNIYTNPAAYHQSSGQSMSDGDPTHDGLGGLPDSPVLSPTLTGTTLDAGQPPAISHRRARPPPGLNLDRTVEPSGVLRSERPSVSDWAHGPDSEPSPCSDEIRLDPYERYPKSPGSVRNGRQMASRSVRELDFMTSALKE